MINELSGETDWVVWGSQLRIWKTMCHIVNTALRNSELKYIDYSQLLMLTERSGAMNKMSAISTDRGFLIKQQLRSGDGETRQQAEESRLGRGAVSFTSLYYSNDGRVVNA